MTTLTLETAEERELWVSEFARRLAGTGDPPGVGAKYAARLAWDAVRAYRERCKPPLPGHLAYPPADDAPEPGTIAEAIDMCDKMVALAEGLHSPRQLERLERDAYMRADAARHIRAILRRCAPTETGPITHRCKACKCEVRDIEAWVGCDVCEGANLVDIRRCAPGASEPTRRAHQESYMDAVEDVLALLDSAGMTKAKDYIEERLAEEPDNSGLDALRAVVESDAEWREIRAEEAGPAMCDHDDVYPGEFCMDCHEVKPMSEGPEISEVRAAARRIADDPEQVQALADEVADGVARTIGGAPTGPGWPKMPRDVRDIERWGPYWWHKNRPREVDVFAAGIRVHLYREAPLLSETDPNDWGGPCLQGSAPDPRLAAFESRVRHAVTNLDVVGSRDDDVGKCAREFARDLHVALERLGQGGLQGSAPDLGAVLDAAKRASGKPDIDGVLAWLWRLEQLRALDAGLGPRLDAAKGDA